jgi:type 1 glutamine amidotransferase
LLCACQAQQPGRVLLFSKTAGYRHDSIPAALSALRTLSTELGLPADASEDATLFTDKGLAPYRAIVFISVSGPVLETEAQLAFQRWVQAGGGFLGIHASEDSGGSWPFYNELIGAVFKMHPDIQPAALDVEDAAHPATRELPARWQRTDEWHAFQANPRGKVHVLLRIDESTYAGGPGGDHPLAWCHTASSGRAFYTALGHTTESWSEPLFLSHVKGALAWVSAKGAGDCK